MENNLVFGEKLTGVHYRTIQQCLYHNHQAWAVLNRLKG